MINQDFIKYFIDNNPLRQMKFKKGAPEAPLIFNISCKLHSILFCLQGLLESVMSIRKNSGQL
jgi:hypothetical protein